MKHPDTGRAPPGKRCRAAIPAGPAAHGLAAGAGLVVVLPAGRVRPARTSSPHNPVPWWLMLVFGTALVPAGLASMLAHRAITLRAGQLETLGALLFSRRVPVTELVLDKAHAGSGRTHRIQANAPARRLQPSRFHCRALPARNLRPRCLLTARRNVLLLPQRDVSSSWSARKSRRPCWTRGH